MTNKDILKEFAAISERITRLERSIMSHLITSNNDTKELIANVEDALCELSKEEVE